MNNITGGYNKLIMSIDDVITNVANVCKQCGVEKLVLIGSFATGTATPTSDIDFVVYGCKDLDTLETHLESVETLRKIDIFDYDAIHNEYLLEDIEKYGKQIY